MKSWNNKNSPLGRWLSSPSYHDGSFKVENTPIVEPDPVDAAHWIMFGVLPSDSDARYWTERAETGSLYEFLQLMYDASSPSIVSDLEKLSRLVGPANTRFGRSVVSPTMTIIRIYRRNAIPTPGPRKILKHLQAILRRPTDPVNFSRHIEHTISRDRPYRRVYRALSRAVYKPFSEALVLSEILLIENSLRLIHDRRAVNILSRAISPPPEFVRRPPSVTLTSQFSDKALGDSIQISGVDLAVLEQALRPLLPMSRMLPAGDEGERIVEIFARAFGREPPDALVVGAYRLLLGRQPEYEGYIHYVEMLNSGVLSASDVVRDILKSEEYLSVNSIGEGGN